MIEIGQQFGLYMIKEVVTSGDSHFCCKAEDPFFNREVILKLFSPELFGGEQNLNLLENLLERLAVLDHPSIAPVYDSGIEELLFYYTSAICSGSNLAEMLGQKLPEDELLKLLAELTQALIYAAEEGVEQGPLSLEQLYIDADGRAVIADFGIDQGIRQLFSPGEQAELLGEKATAQTLRSLGELILKFGLGPLFDESAAEQEQVNQIDDQRLQRLAARLLLPEEAAFNSYQTLLETLAEVVELDQQNAAAEQDQGIELMSNSLPAEQPQQSDEQTGQAVVEVRRLVAENNDLQQSIEKLIIERDQSNSRFKEGARQLKAAQVEAEKAREEADVAWELVAGQKHDRWRPAQWAVGGFVIGFLLSGSYGYYFNQQTRDDLMAKLKKQEELIKTAAWRTSQPAVAQKPAAKPETGNQPAPVASVPQPQQTLAVVKEPVKQEAKQWWPVGDEFSPTAAISMEKIKAALGLQKVQVVSDKVSDNLRQEVETIVYDWAKSWSSKDLNNYFTYYSDSYRPELGRSQNEWREIRRSRLTRPQWISVLVDDLRVRKVEDNFVQVKMKQTYRSDVYQDQIFKSLNLIRENGQWRILMERSLGMASEIVGG